MSGFSGAWVVRCSAMLCPLRNRLHDLFSILACAEVLGCRVVTARTLVVVVAMLVTGAWGGQGRRSGVSGPVVRDPPPPDSIAGPRLDRLEHWLYAVDHHVAGDADAEVLETGALSNAALQLLWIDANVL